MRVHSQYMRMYNTYITHYTHTQTYAPANTNGAASSSNDDDSDSSAHSDRYRSYNVVA